MVKDLGNGDLSRIMALAKEKETFDDWPWIILYKELDKAFPGSQFILTKRESEKWLISYKNMLKNQGDASSELNEIRRILYNLPFPDVSELQLIERYEKHNADVENYFRDRSKDLLVVNWGKGSGWKELCDFLGKEIPNEPFPHANKGQYTQKSFFSRLTNGIKKWL